MATVLRVVVDPRRRPSIEDEHDLLEESSPPHHALDQEEVHQEESESRLSWYGSMSTATMLRPDETEDTSRTFAQRPPAAMEDADCNAPWLLVDQNSRTSSPVVTPSEEKAFAAWNDFSSNPLAIASSASQSEDECYDADDEPPPLLDMETVEATTHENMDLATTGQSGHVGLVNLGNLCYMAAALQQLSSLCDNDPHNFLRPAIEHVNSSNSDGDETPDTTTLPLHAALRQVLQHLVGEPPSATDPTRLVQDWKQVLDQHTSLFLDNDEQQDAHEFLTTLLDLLDREYKQQQQAKVPPSPESSEPVSEPKENPAVDYAPATTSKGYWSSSEEEEKKEETVPVAATGPPRPGKLVVRQGNFQMDWSGRSSFSELDEFGIEHLLRQDCLCRAVEHGGDLYHCAAPTACRLAGGRMNVPDDSFLPPPVTPATSTTTSTTNATPTLSDDHASNDVETEQQAVPNKSSPIDDTFAMKVRVHLTCDSCSYTRTHDESFWHLSLDCGDSGSTSVVEGLARFFAPERRELKCSKCFAESATQRMEIIKLPRALLLHMKRFTVDVVMNKSRNNSYNPFSFDVEEDDESSSDYFASVSYSKNSSPVSFPEELTLSDDGATSGWWKDFVASDCVTPDEQLVQSGGGRYELRSVVNHIGSTVSRGHYTTDAYRCPRNQETALEDGDAGSTDDASQREWMRFDDTIVTPISAHQALTESSRTAYMIAYEFVDEA